MKDATYWKEYREKRKKKLESEFKVATMQPDTLQPEPKSATESVTCPPAGTVATEKKLDYGKGLIIHPDKFKGLHDPEYYQKCCIYCGNPKTSLVKRNGFLGHLCEAHTP